MNKLQLVQLTRRRQISGSSYEQLIGLLVGEMKQRTAKPQIAASRLSGKYAERIINSFTAELPECQTCGACCAFYTCVTVAETDAVPRSHYWKIGEHQGCSSAGGRQLRRDPHSNTCVGLEGEIGKEVRCGIYSRRPAVCRNFEAGSDQCHAARRAFRLEPALTEDQLARALGRLAAREADERRQQASDGMVVISTRSKRAWTLEGSGRDAGGELFARQDAA